MIVVSGRIYVAAGDRETFVNESLTSIKAARIAQGCRDFVVAPDPLESDRVNVYEEWETKEDLMAFRGAGPSADLSQLITKAEVAEYYVATNNVPGAPDES
ncbi:MAG: antibiotic biosynthesis monooxygenase family protein [Cyanobacteria bacterium J06621_11]